MQAEDIIQLKGASWCLVVDSWLVIGEVVGVHIAEAMLLGWCLPISACAAFLRGGGDQEIIFTISE